MWTLPVNFLHLSHNIFNQGLESRSFIRASNVARLRFGAIA